MKITINLILLAGSLAIYSAIPKQKNKIIQVLETIPAFKAQKSKIIQGAAEEAGKVVLIYAISWFALKMSGVRI